MVQPSGQIFGLSPEASIAVQCHLFKLGYSHISASGVLPGMSAIYWYTSKRIWPVPPMSNDLTTHKLADFGLNEDGEPLTKPFKDGDRVVADEALTKYIRYNNFEFDVAQHDAPLDDLKITLTPSVDGVFWARGKGVCIGLCHSGLVYNEQGDGIAGHILHAPTFGQLKAGDSCPFVVGKEVSGPCNSKGRVTKTRPGPEVLIEWQLTSLALWAKVGGANTMGITHDINTIFPVQATQPAQEPAQAYEDGNLKEGSPVLDNKDRPCTILAIREGYAMCRFAEGPSQNHPVRTVELRKLRPAETTFTLANRSAIADKRGVTIEGITMSIAELEKALFEAKKIQS